MALSDDRTYFTFQDNLFGEMFDNSMRIKLLVDNNKKYASKCNLDELEKKAKLSYKEDVKNGNFN